MPETSSSPPDNILENLDESTALSFLKELIATGDHSLDPVLGTIADIARQLTAASGAALAMWKDGAMVCRARSGEIAPVLGAQLSTRTGISGECLRTGKIQHCADTENDPLVDLEVCRSLGLRSISVLPIRGWRGTNGILEVFSTRPAVFTEQHIAILQKLAALAERARTSQPESKSSATPPPRYETEKPPRGVAPAADLVGDVSLASQGVRLRPLVWGATGLVALSLLAMATWLGWRGLERAGKTNAAPSSTVPASGSTANAGPATTSPATLDVAIGSPPNKEPLATATADGESLKAAVTNPPRSYPPNAKPSAGSPVKLASKVDAVAGKNTQAYQSKNRSLSSGAIAPNPVITHGGSNPGTGSNAGARNDSQTNLRSDTGASSEPLSIPESAAGQSPLSGVLSANASLPRLGAPASRGVSGGQLVQHVPPVYPIQARLRHLEGKVVLTAVIMEDGTVRDVKVVDGPPLLGQSAADAVKDWRYKPFELDGKPLKNEIRITVDFKLPNH